MRTEFNTKYDLEVNMERMEMNGDRNDDDRACVLSLIYMRAQHAGLPERRGHRRGQSQVAPTV